MGSPVSRDEAGQGGEPGKGRRKEPSPPPDGAILYEFWEAAWVLRCSAATVRRMADTGILPTVSVSPGGHRRVIRKTSLESFIRSRERTASEEPAPAAPSPATARALATIKADWMTEADPFARPARKAPKVKD